MKRLLLAAGALLAFTACPTRFVGDAHFPGGPQGCEERCSFDGLEMSGFVYSGEFSSSCVCRAPKPSARSISSGAQSPVAPAAATAPTTPTAPTDELAERGPADAVSDGSAEADRQIEEARAQAQDATGVNGGAAAIEAANAAAVSSERANGDQSMMNNRNP